MTRLIAPLMGLVALTIQASTAAARVENLSEFLRAVEASSAVLLPLRADGEMRIQGTTGDARNPVVMVVRPPLDTYIELREGGGKALLLSSAGQAYRVAAPGAKTEAFAGDAPLGGSDFTREDLEPFQLARYRSWTIADEGVNEVTVTLVPTTSQYTLQVSTFDVEKKVPLKTLYYQDTLNNLVKLRRDDEHVLIGRRWMPTTMTMQSFKLRTATTLQVKWSQDAVFPPELFDPAFLPRTLALDPRAAASR